MLLLLVAYLAVGIIVALAFVIAGVTKVQPIPVTLGARIVLWPGAFLLWPYVAVRWLKSRAPR
jgi:glucose-6-phosphate-specific signal transduction histidine kinase